MSSEAKNLEAICKAIDQHNASCEGEAVGVAMNPYEVDRLGWDEIRGLPIEGDPNLGTGRFRIICANEGDRDKEITEAVSSPETVEVTTTERELVPAYG